MPSQDFLALNPGYKAARAPRMRYEEDAQIELMRRVYDAERDCPSLCFIHHSPNGAAMSWSTDARGNRYSKEAWRMKAQGARPGWPDLVAPVIRYDATRNVTYTGLVIELKFNGGKVSAEQERWLSHFRQQGWRVEVCDAPTVEALADAAWSIVKEYFGL